MEENIQTVWVSVRPWRTMRSLRERPIFGRDWVARTMNQTRIQGVLPGKIAMEKNVQTLWASTRPWRILRSLRERPIFGRDLIVRTMNQA